MAARSVEESGGWTAAPAERWSEAGLAEAREVMATLDTDALMIVERGRVVFSFGRIEARFKCHSIRKSILGALIGFEVEAGRLSLEATLDELGIDDREGLTARERQATLFDLLCARSGVYHPTVAETERMRATREPRGSHGPGTFWCYNNWDFNALGTILERGAGRTIYDLFGERLAAPLGMEDWRESDPDVLRDDAVTEHPALGFRLSARDLARFGLLYARGGVWGGRQIVSERWVRASLLPYSHAGPEGAYGFMWWIGRDGVLFPGAVVPAGAFAARGYRGHVVLALPEQDIVIVHRTDTDRPGRAVTRWGFDRLLDRLLGARLH